MLPPIGVKAEVRSSTRVRLTWTDTSLGRNQRVPDSLHYVVRYNPKLARKQRFVNSTDLTADLFDLRPDTEYEFSVKVVKGQRRSTWSLSVFNRTLEAGKSSYSYLYIGWRDPEQAHRHRNHRHLHQEKFAERLLQWETEAHVNRKSFLSKMSFERKISKISHVGKFKRRFYKQLQMTAVVYKQITLGQSKRFV